MSISRLARHLFATRRRVHRAFPRPALLAIEQAIKASRSAHVGEIRFAVEGAVDAMPLFKGYSARDRAIEVFSQLRVWDTEHNNGVLIFLLLADRHVEIVADRGVHVRVGSQEWESICRTMEAAFKQGHYQQGVVSGIEAVTRHLTTHFPTRADQRSDLADKPALLKQHDRQQRRTSKPTGAHRLVCSNVQCSKRRTQSAPRDGCDRWTSARQRWLPQLPACLVAAIRTPDRTVSSTVTKHLFTSWIR